MNTREYQQQYRDALSSMLRSPSGKLFLWEQMTRGGVFRQSYVAGSSDGTAFNEGQRSNALRLLDELLEVNPNALGILRRELVAREQAANVETETDG